ncbi:MAG: DUF2185 domain-containing protein [Lachnospiraceae bacterium]|nr:DUF2185 domain-containing protein [Lachnospiraceae bacterium]
MSEIMDEVVRKVKILQTRLEFAQFGERKELNPFDFCICMTAVHSVLSRTKPVGLVPTDHPDMEKLKAHLAHKTKATDKEGIIQYLSRVRSYGCGRKYFDFWSFWHNRPTFKVEDLKEENRERFEELMEFSKSFEELLGPKGYVAWDVAESIQIVREAYLCRYIDEALACEIISDFGEMAVHSYQDWTDFAISYICGGCYFIYENNGNLEEVDKMCDTICGAVEQLFFSDDNAIWAHYKWQKPKPYFNGFHPTEDLVDSKIGCYVTNRVSLDGCQINYMEKQLPNPQYPDSGWKFMAGDETVEYLSDGTNIAVFSLNLIANYDKEILPLIDAPIGSVYVRNEEGKFVLREKKEDE